MTESEVLAEPLPEPSGSNSLRRLGRPILAAVLIVLVFVGWQLVPAWLSLLWSSLPRSMTRSVTTGFLNVLLVAYALVVVALVVGLVSLAVALVRSPGAIRRRPWLARLVLLGVSILVSLGFLEAATAAWLGWIHRVPKLPQPAPPSLADPRNLLTKTGNGNPSTGQPFRILVVGESSARGEPYHPWLSVGQIVGWQLERVFPGRKVQVDVWAKGGSSLEGVNQNLTELTYRPDALLLFCGHNEFQGRFAWSRDVPYYPEERTRERPLSMAESVLRTSPVCRLILEMKDRQRVDSIPPRKVTRELVDRPVCTEQERRGIVADFKRRIEALTDYCKTIGTVAIYVVPGSNDGGYEPSRSILPATASALERLGFARDFQAVRQLETSDPARAITAYRALIDRAPGFAESHYRLAGLLRKQGAWDEAREHYRLAREYDAMPMRCPEELRQVYREAAARHPEIVLVDSTPVLEKLAPHGSLDDHLYHDAQHPTLRGYIALAQDLLKQLEARRAFDWPAATAMPVIDPDECARHFQLDDEKWSEVCTRSAWFYGVTAFIRHDPTERQGKETAYELAAELIEEGERPEQAGITGLGVHPAGLP
jgi:hypothetical protein